MPQISKFTAPSGEVIRIYYNSRRKLFYASLNDQEYANEREEGLLKKLKDATQYKYDWQAVIEITIKTETWDSQTLKFSFQRYYIAKYFGGHVESGWDNLNDRGDWRSESNHYIENFRVPLHNPKKGQHIIEYDANIWENLNRIKQLITELGKKISDSFEDNDFINRLKGPILKALPGGENE